MPSLTQTYASSDVTTRPSRNETQTAAPATAPASPSSAKMPAPIMEPIPSTVAPGTDIVFDGAAAGSALSGGGGGANASLMTLPSGRGDRGGRPHNRPSGIVDHGRLEQREPEVGHALQETLELGLVADTAGERRGAPGAYEGHVPERQRGAVAELPFDDQAIRPVGHISENGTSRRALTRNAGRSPG